MKIADTRPASVSELSDIVTAFYESHDANPPTLPTYDAVARALGVADTCTGNSDTATESVAHTPKSGLSVAFYSVNPTHRNEEGRPLTAYYVATWKGAQYRGHVLLSCRGYHADEPRGFVCYDQAPYSANLPDGCRTLVAALVADAVVSSGVNLADMVQEWAAAATYYEISSQLSKAKWALEDAARVENRGK
jgi:hypothetical protein